MPNRNQEITTRAAYEAACIKFVESLMDFDPTNFVYALTDLSLIAAQQQGEVNEKDLDTSLCLIRHFRDLRPVQAYYEKK
jgi:hypothetical protein